jgi:hypothetical protein
MSDLSQATRELFIRSLVDEVFMRTPIIEDVVARRKMTFKGGTSIKRLVDTEDIDDLVQEYSANTALSDDKKETLEKPEFKWKLAQLPLRYDVDEYLQNITAGTEEQLLDLSEHLTQKGQRATKLYMEKQIFNQGSATVTTATDSGVAFQNLVAALLHDNTYGGLTRSFSAGTNDWWQGADPKELNENVSSSAQSTAAPLTLANLRKWINESDVGHHMESPDDLMIAACPTLYDKLLAEMESRVIYNVPSLNSNNGKGSISQGVRKATFDGHTIVSCPYLQKSSTTRAWLFILNMQWWEYRVHVKRNFDLTPFEWQGKNSNGYDNWLARIMWAGNFVCWKPNSSMFLSSVS